MHLMIAIVVLPGVCLAAFHILAGVYSSAYLRGIEDGEEGAEIAHQAFRPLEA